MIANFTSGSDSGVLVRYLMGYGKGEKSDKQAVVLGAAGVRTDTLSHLIADFELGRKLHPELNKSVLHISLSFNPDDAARMTNLKMRQVAEEYLEKMDLKGTQYLLVRHRDRPHHHLHIMANRVATDGHTIADGNNFYDSKKALGLIMAKHNLTPAKGHRPHLQHPERLRSGDLAKYEIREALRRALATETQRAVLLATLREQGIASREFISENGNVMGISFQKDGYACKGSALGREFSLPAIDKQLAANQRNAPEMVSNRAELLISPMPDKAEIAVSTALPSTVELATIDQLQVASAVKEPVATGAEMTAVNRYSQEVELRESAQQLQVSAPVPTMSGAVAREPEAAPAEVPVASSHSVAAGATTLGVPVIDAPSVVSAGEQSPASPGMSATTQQADTTSANAPLSASPAGASPTIEEAAPTPLVDPTTTPVVSAKISSMQLEEALARWEAEQEAEAEQDRLADAYEAWLELGGQVRQQVATATHEVLATGAAFTTLLDKQGLTLLPATADEPVRVQHQASGEVFSSEEVPLPQLLLTPTRQATAQYGVIQMQDNESRPAPERLALVREHLLAVGLTMGLVEPARPGQPAQLAYAFSPQQVDLTLVESKLNEVQTSPKTWVFEAPHAWQSPARQAYGQTVPRAQWPEREGRFNQARIEIDNADQRAPGRAERLRAELREQGVLLSQVQTDGQGRLTFELRYHTLTPGIEGIDSILCRAKGSEGIHLQESEQQQRARFRGIMTLAERQKNLEYDRDR